MRILQLVKTSDGAAWAPLQAAELVRSGVEVHVALPTPEGRQIAAWRASGARLHFVPTDAPVRTPWRWTAVRQAIRELIARIQPDLIHSHFVGTTLMVRAALGRSASLPRVFQVPGPLHLEHGLYRRWEIGSAGPADHWIPSSRYIRELYAASGVARERLYLSYYGTTPAAFPAGRDGVLRHQLGLADDALVVGNVSYMYPPKYYLGQRVGVKRHELMLDALALASREERRLAGVLVGGAWGRHQWYERRLRRRAAALSDRLHLTGALPHEAVRQAWAEFDVVLHAPLSENCGGAAEALLAAVPVVAARVGGLPEIVIDGVTGVTVAEATPRALADAVLAALADLPRRRTWAARGRQLLHTMFDVRRTAAEVHAIYRHILDPRQPRPADFDANAATQDLLRRAA